MSIDQLIKDYSYSEEEEHFPYKKRIIVYDYE
jgi:hypothetical protein